MALAPTNQHGKRLRKRYGKVRSHLFTFLDHPDVPPDNHGSERELRPTATYRKVTGAFRSQWGARQYADIRAVIETGRRQSIGALQAIRNALADPLDAIASDDRAEAEAEVDVADEPVAVEPEPGAG